MDTLTARSTDGGATWTTPTPLNSNAASDSGDDWARQIASDGAGNWVAVWESDDSLFGTIGDDWDILAARSTDGGATWTDPVPLNSNAAADSGWDMIPQIAADSAGNWVAVWSSSDNPGGTIGDDWDILTARSTDCGATWTAPVSLGSAAASDSGDDWAPQITLDSEGNWGAVWGSSDSLGGTIGDDWDILAARSTDGGVTWTDPTPWSSNASSDSGSDIVPRIEVDSAGQWVAVWQSSDSLGGTIGNDYDIFVASGGDVGRIDLGLIDSGQVHSINSGGSESVWLRLETTHAGWLTFESTTEQTSAELTMTLHSPTDLDTVLASSNGSDAVPRFDYAVQPGESYMVKMTGSSTDATLQYANLVHQDGDTVTVHGTPRADVFAFDAGASHEITINEVAYHFEDTEVSTVTFDGGGERDVAWLYDSPGDETLEAWPDRAVFKNGTDDGIADFTVNVSGIESLLSYATRGGTDLATLHDSEGADKFKSYEQYVRVRAKDCSYFLRAKMFDSITADSGSGGNDVAIFNGTKDDETFRYDGVENAARFEAVDRDHAAIGFGEIIARGGGGSGDEAHFTDTRAEDVFYFRNHKTVLTSSEVKITARAFDEAYATASEGEFDVARIYDTTSDEHLEVAGDTARMYRKIGTEMELIYAAIGFERVRAYSTEGDDTKDIQNSVIDLILNGWGD